MKIEIRLNELDCIINDISLSKDAIDNYLYKCIMKELVTRYVRQHHIPIGVIEFMEDKDLFDCSSEYLCDFVRKDNDTQDINGFKVLSIEI